MHDFPLSIFSRKIIIIDIFLLKFNIITHTFNLKILVLYSNNMSHGDPNNEE